MRAKELTETFQDDANHAKALKKTGFWGKAGSGVLLFATSTKRFGIALRSAGVEQPRTWGVVGGALDAGLTPEQGAVKEATQELGKLPEFKLEELDLYQNGTFRYTTFLMMVENEFKPKLNWENEDFQWFEFGQWPTPLHFGFAATIKKPEILKRLQEL